MPRKRVNCPLVWTFVDENIENVERLSLGPEIQRELGCVVGEHVFLEFPWVFVPRETILQVAKTPGSPLEPFKSKIETYQAESFLLGYSSVELYSHDFVICATEEAKSAILKRNKDITKNILEAVTKRIEKRARPRTSLGTEAELNESFVKNTREYLEIEISLSPDSLGAKRNLTNRNSADARDSYVHLTNEHDEFDIIFRRLVSRGTQTHFPPRSIDIQTYPGHPKNVWTQYVYEDTLGERAESENVDGEEKPSGEAEPGEEDRSEEKSNAQESRTSSGMTEKREPEEKTPLELFLDSRAEEMIDIVKYNAVVNLHIDDIDKLSEQTPPMRTRMQNSFYKELASFIDLRFTKDKIAADASWHPQLPGYVAVSYISKQKSSYNSKGKSVLNNRSADDLKFETRILLWSLEDPLQPCALLEDHRNVSAISFCPDRENVLIGGCSTGQVIVWDISEQLNNQPNNRKNLSVKNKGPDIPVTRAIVVSDKQRSHHLAVRKIEWLPANYRIEQTGNLNKLSTASNPQFMTASEDGSVAVWDLPRYLHAADARNPEYENAFKPVYRFLVRVPDEPENLLIFSFCLPSGDAVRKRELHSHDGALDSTEESYVKSFWTGTAEGLLRCSWQGQMFEAEASCEEECRLLNRSHVHDGPVTGIQRSPHLPEVLLTIGGHVFAIWKDDYLESPIFRRSSTSRCTASCWTTRPGVFLIGRDDGDLETWDIKKKTNGPVVTQTISTRWITGLYFADRREEDRNVIGVADSDGVFRVLWDQQDDQGDKLERMDWFEEYIWREVRRKKVFHSWQSDFLANDPGAIARRAARREEERKRKLKESREKLQREHAERERAEAERRARSAPKTKDAIWKAQEYERSKSVILAKKNLVPAELEEKRQPAVISRQERERKLLKAENKVRQAETQFENELSVAFPDAVSLWQESTIREAAKTTDSERTTDEYVEMYLKVRDNARELLRKYSDAKTPWVNSDESIRAEDQGGKKNFPSD